MHYWMPIIEYIDMADYLDASAFTAYIHKTQRQGCFVVTRNFDSHRVSLNTHKLHAKLWINIKAWDSVHYKLFHAPSIWLHNLTWAKAALCCATNPAELHAFETHTMFPANIADPSWVETILHCTDPSNYVAWCIAYILGGRLIHIPLIAIHTACLMRGHMLSI